jgi:hypothetical protein
MMDPGGWHDWSISPDEGILPGMLIEIVVV